MHYMKAINANIFDKEFKTYLIMKHVCILVMILFCFKGISQEEPAENFSGNNEFKLNVGYVIAGLPEVTYERILSDETSVGFSAAFSIDEDIDYDFIAVPYFRFYFGKKRNAGFFIEANTGIFTEENNDAKTESELGLGAGMAVGAKFITRKGWVAELVGGLGRNFLNTDVLSEVYPRVGISIGKRF